MAGGGTGGHLFPALALAEEFKKKVPDVEIIFMGGRGGLEERVVPKHGYPLVVFDVEGIKRRTGLKRIKAIGKAARSTVRAIGLLRSIRPDGVIGSGSYSSAPVVMAARLLGIKTAILEQNAMPGLTNRWLGKFVDRIYIAFEQAKDFFPARRTLLAGNPIRREIIEGPASGARAAHNGHNGAGHKAGRKFSVLVFGGSQGATAINTAFLDATEYLTDIWPVLRVVHQAGEDGYQKARESYKRKNLKVELHTFIDDMAAAYRSSDLVVCRAGATSIAEITALGIAPILIPYPFAADDHQTVNARCLAEAGAAVMIKQDKLTGSSLAGAIRSLYENPAELKSMRDKVKGFGRPHAGEMIAENFLEAIG